ncbi:MAG TPA: pitrilysin family protein [Candidatus Bathyarchaeia archaeon]|nr:pitrilysin family protein [Candidatus Bathyarchaeia archaeon]
MSLDTKLPELVSEHEPAEGIKTLIHHRDDNPTLAVYGSLRAGTSSEPAGKSGLAELTSRLFIRGSNDLGAEKIADQLESVGASISFRNSQDSIVFQAKTTSPWTERVLGILAECLARPGFDESDIQKEKEILLTDIRLRDDNTTRRGMRELHRLVYPPNHPYSRDRFGTSDTVKKLERGDIAEYFDHVVKKSPVVVAFAGQLKDNIVLGWTTETFGVRQPDEKMPTSAIESRTEASTQEIVMPHKTQADILIGCQATSRTEPDYEPLNLLNVILGELGFMGRLGDKIRDREGLAYSASSFINAGLIGGNWTAIAGVNPKNLNNALELMHQELDKARTRPVQGKELASAKQNQIGSALMELESTDGIARTSHNLAHFNLGLDYFSNRRKLYKNIDRKALLRIAQKYLDPSRLSTVIVGPKARF